MLMVTQHSLCEIVLWLLTLAYLNIEFLKVLIHKIIVLM